MKILVNDEERDFAADATVLDVVSQLGLNPKVVVAQRNGDIVPREAFGAAVLCDGDRLDLIRFVGGG